MKRGQEAKVATELGISRAYLTMMLKGKRPIPDRFAPLLTNQILLLERETGLEPATTCLEGRDSAN